MGHGLNAAAADEYMYKNYNSYYIFDETHSIIHLLLRVARFSLDPNNYALWPGSGGYF